MHKCIGRWVLNNLWQRLCEIIVVRAGRFATESKGKCQAVTQHQKYISMFTGIMCQRKDDSLSKPQRIYNGGSAFPDWKPASGSCFTVWLTLECGVWSTDD